MSLSLKIELTQQDVLIISELVPVGCSGLPLMCFVAWKRSAGWTCQHTLNRFYLWALINRLREPSVTGEYSVSAYRDGYTVWSLSITVMRKHSDWMQMHSTDFLLYFLAVIMCIVSFSPSDMIEQCKILCINWCRACKKVCGFLPRYILMSKKRMQITINHSCFLKVLKHHFIYWKLIVLI